MPNDINWDDDDDNDGAETPEQPTESQLIKQLRKQIAKSAKRITELETENTGFAQTRKEDTIKEVLSKKGVNPKAARLLLKELDEVSETTIEAWLKDNDDLFAPAKPADEKEISAEEQANLAELQRQNNLTNAGATPTNAQSLEARILATRSMSPAEGKAALAEIIASQQ